MSRPTTRGKGKRQREGDNAEVTSEIFRKIYASGGINGEDISKLYMTHKPVCQGCRVNTKDNPNCFCGLIPPPNGSRKSGLWQKMSEIVQELGPDPREDRRTSADWPAGLTNLGATCYANSILQFLYMNRAFRKGVFSVEPEVLKTQPVLDQLAQLFVHLHASKKAYIDSAPFIKTLELDNGVQQDSHEFLTLLLSLLECCLRHSKFSEARTVVQDLFRGTVSHVTICSNCGRNSEASLKLEDFYELELNIKGLKTLDESLDDYLSVEELRGENQYFCESCQKRVDASRSIKLRTLPDILNFQLKRCVFLPKTTAKKKITTSFAFPGELDMQGRLFEPSQSEWKYDLSAVLIHKGTAVNSGHYVAHIKDEITGQWWEFDDEQVSKLGNHPFGGGSSNSTSKAVQVQAISNLPCSEEKIASTNGNNEDALLKQDSKSSNGQMFSSSDAYMLIYNRRHARKGDEERPFACGANDVKLGDHESTSHDSCLPSHLSEAINGSNVSYLASCKDYEVKKEKEVQHITERRQEVRSILAEAPVHAVEEPFYWVSTEWLRQWCDIINPPGLDNAPIQCKHGKVPVGSVGSMKRVSAGAWKKLLSKYDGGPMLTNGDYCTSCLIDGAQSVVSADSYRDSRVSMRDRASFVLSGQCQDGDYYISKTWLQQWVRRKNFDAPSEADAGPTASITCPHGQLLPEKAPGARRLLVPEDLWLFFYKDAMAVKGDDPLSCATFPSDSGHCIECTDELSEAASSEDSLRARKIKQRQNHEKLSIAKNIPLSFKCRYYLVPTPWLANWRNYVNAIGKNISSSMEPEPLGGIICSLKCEKHSRLVESPPDLVYKRGALLQKNSTTDALTIISETDWNGFCEEWGGDKDNGISAIIESSTTPDSSLEGLCEGMAMDVENLDPQEEITNGSVTRLPVIKTTPEICEECIGERKSHELMQKLNYCNEDIFVTLIHSKEAPKSILEARESAFELDRRTSKRSRKARNGNTVNLKVSATTSIYQLKMMIWESLGVIKENQILHKGSRIVDQESATLADSSIFPGDKLWVQDSEIHEHRDIADELAYQKMDAQHCEEGFRGTLLTADTSLQGV